MISEVGHVLEFQQIKNQKSLILARYFDGFDRSVF